MENNKREKLWTEEKKNLPYQKNLYKMGDNRIRNAKLLIILILAYVPQFLHMLLCPVSLA